MTLLQRIPAPTSRETLIPILETERLILRPPQAEDAEGLATLINDRRIAENTARVPHPYTLADAEDFIADAAGSTERNSFLITLTDGTLVGGCGIGAADSTMSDLGYWIGVPFWGQGYATEAARALVDHAFADMGYASLRACARVSNPASRRVLEKCGFQWTGVALARVRAINSSAPVDRFRHDRSLWASLKSWGKVRRLA